MCNSPLRIGSSHRDELNEYTTSVLHGAQERVSKKGWLETAFHKTGISSPEGGNSPSSRALRSCRSCRGGASPTSPSPFSASSPKLGKASGWALVQGWEVAMSTEQGAFSLRIQICARVRVLMLDGKASNVVSGLQAVP